MGVRGKYRAHGRHDVNLAARAIAAGWDVPLAKRAGIVKELLKIATGKDPDAGPREQIRALEALLRIPGIQIDAAMAKIAQEKWKRAKDGGGVDLPGLIGADDQYNADGAGHPDEVPE